MAGWLAGWLAGEHILLSRAENQFCSKAVYSLLFAIVRILFVGMLGSGTWHISKACPPNPLGKANGKYKFVYKRISAYICIYQDIQMITIQTTASHMLRCHEMRTIVRRNAKKLITRPIMTVTSPNSTHIALTYTKMRFDNFFDHTYPPSWS